MRLHQMLSQAVVAPNIEEALAEILSAAADILQADFGNIQLLDPISQTLTIVAHRGFDQAFLNTFAEVDAEDDSACGQALRRRQRVLIKDVETDLTYLPYRADAAAAGYRAVQSTPLINAQGEMLGMLSTHYRQPTRLTVRDEQLLDIIAYYTANLLERLRIEERLEARVHERTAEVQTLSLKLIHAEMEERAHLAQLLHDDLQQQLFAVKIQLGLLRENSSDAVVREEIETAEAALSDVIRSTRWLSADLYPPILQSENFAEAMRWLSGQMQQQYGLHIDLEAEADFPLPDQDKRVILFQAVREFLFNVIKHAQVTQVTLRLQSEDTGYRINISDEGVGFDPQQVLAGTSPAQGQGLRNAHERLRLIGGRLEIEAAPGAGTHSIIYVPLDGPASPAEEV
jgi:signal transduction histidine kinase